MKPLVQNRRARADYTILDTLQAGLVLQGPEVKSVKRGSASLAGSFITLKGDELFLRGAIIPPYQPLNTPSDYDPTRDRKLLLHKEEARALIGRKRERGLTFVPLSLYTSKGTVKLEFAVARGKKKYDKRETLKKRDSERQVRRELKSL